MGAYAILLGAVNFFLLIVLLIILKKYLSLKPVSKEVQVKSSKVERIKQMIQEEPDAPPARKIDDTKAFIRGMLASGKTDPEIITELKRRGISEAEVRGMLEEER